ESLSPTFGMIGIERPIGRDGEALALIKSYSPRGMDRIGRHQNQSLDPRRLSDPPLHRLLPSQRSADQHSNPIDPEVIRQEPMSPHHIPNRKFRERKVVRMSGGWINASRMRGPVRRTEDIGTNDKMILGIEQ